MRVLLDGYFDSNFGDDYMMKIIVHSLPEIDFVIEERKPVSPIILDEPNVCLTGETEGVPKLLVTGSGFMINSRTALWCEIKWFLRRKHIADYCVGCNIEPFDCFIKNFLIYKKLQKFKLIVCRDQKSYLWFKNNGLNAVCLPDILFSMPDEWLKKETEAGKLGISVLHRQNDASDCKYYISMAEAADYWVEKTGRGVYLLAFNTGTEDDIYACNCVKSLMKYSCKAEIIRHGFCGEIIKAYSYCDKIIGARFHSGVLAIRMGIDFFPIVYREKMSNMLSDVRYPAQGCDINNTEIQKIKAFLDNGIKYEFPQELILKAKDYARLILENICAGCDA